MAGQSATDPTHGGTFTDPAQSVIEKGKGKATEDVSMGEDDDDSSDEETGAEEDEPEPAEEDEDDLQEIDTDNIVGGRTRGKAIDYDKIDPSEFPEDDDDEDDDDFEDPDANHDAMQEFGTSSLHQRDARSALFDNYTGDRNRNASSSPAVGARAGYGYGYTGGSGSGAMNGSAGGGYRPATPNSKGQYSDAVLSELENQNDAEVEGISAKVKMLKDITVAIGDEIRDSSKLADTMNNSFDNTRVRLRGTMNRMLRMAEKTGVGWRVWLGFFAAVTVLFWYVWLF
ncbi:MAG: hypothetical protein Q9213_005832 [Squamulea squamosa]